MSEGSPGNPGSNASNARHNREVLVELGAQMRDVFTTAVLLAQESITTGSPLTGAPGQPVDTATLRNSWQVEFEGDDRATIGTPIEYAEPVEDAVGPHGPRVYGAKNGIGGSHSVKLTAANFDRIVDEAKRRVLAGRA